MKGLRYYSLVFVLLLSCNNTPDESNSNENETEKQQEAQPPCGYNAEKDISDSLIILCDEALEKGQNFNPTKWTVSLEKWAGMSFKLSAEITDINSSEFKIVGGKPTESKPYLGLEYGRTEYPFVGGAYVKLFAYFEEDKELVNYEVGQKIQIEGVLQDPYINLDYQSATGSFDWYWIHTNCCKVVSGS